MDPLTKEQFAAALAKGLGRAVLHVRAFGAAGMEETIVQACLQNQVYDWQCEGSRAPWLYGIVVSAGVGEFVLPRVLEALRRPASGKGWRDWAQCYELAAEFAHDGSNEARQAVYDSFDLQTFLKEGLGIEPLIRADGINGFLHGVRSLDWSSLTEDRVDDGWQHLLSYANDQMLGEEAVLAALAEEAPKSASARAFLEFACREIEQDKQRPLGPPPRRSIYESVDAVIAAIEAPKWPGPGVWEGKSEGDAERLFAAMLAETRPEQLKRYLWMFRHLPMPRVEAKILELARAGPEDLRRCARIALGKVDDPAVRSLARELLSQVLPDLDALRLLGSSYRLEDHELIESLLLGVSDSDQAEIVTFQVVRIAERTARPELVPILLWCYEHGHCSICRDAVVERLLSLDAASEDLLRECLCDCWEGTQERASAALGEPPP